MVTKLFLGFTTVGAQWVLWFLILLSVISIALILERYRYFKKTTSQIEDRVASAIKTTPSEQRYHLGPIVVESIVADMRLGSEQRLHWLATIGNNAPFVGLFGTVLGIIRAFHDLSQAAASGSQNSSLVSAGISEALVATAVGLFVAIPAVVAYNYFQRQVKEMLLKAERTKNQILGRA